MDHYLDIQVLPDPEFTENLLLNAVFAKLHRALASLGGGEVGVSFPGADKVLGTHLRLHGTSVALIRLMGEDWIKGVRDHIAIGDVRSVPAVTQYRVVRRIQLKSSAERLRRRSVKNGRLTESEAQERILSSNEKRCKLPFIQLKSNSTGQNFLLFIQQSAPQAIPVIGVFSDYGLSSSATIPYF